MPSPTRVAVVNRGEPAVRFLQTAADLRDGTQAIPLHTIALYTPSEAEALFVRRADEAVDLSRYPASDLAAASPYLDAGRIVAALVDVRADLAWVGWGFLSENPEFAQRCQKAGIGFVGPTSETMRLLADKIEAKQLAERVGIPVAPWSGGAVETVAEAVLAVERIGYPLLVKAAAGGGGMGIRVVQEPEALETAFLDARSEAARVFGDPRVFLEAFVSGGRHLEVQVLADGRGAVWTVGVRDCSVQRRRQKVIEETGPVPVNRELADRLQEYAATLCREAAYRSAGTVEFLVDPVTDAIAFMEVNTRLQVEHPVTELTAGIDLVAAQLQIAMGRPLVGSPPVPRGHAVEVRLNAEDVPRGFVPAPGRIVRLVPPQGPGIRFDTGVEEGDVIASEYDSMIAKIIAWGPDRPTALARARRAVAQTGIVVQGGATNRAFLADLLRHEDLEAGRVDVGWLDRVIATRELVSGEDGAAAVVAAALTFASRAIVRDARRFAASAMRGTPDVRDEAFTITLEHATSAYEVAVAELTGGRYRLTVDGAAVDAWLGPARAGHRELRLGGRAYSTLAFLDGDGVAVQVDGVQHQVDRADRGGVRAPLSGVVVRTLVSPGDEVVEGQRLVVLECMKLETELVAPAGGWVREVRATPNLPVRSGDVLVRLDTVDTPSGGSGPRLRMPEPSPGLVAPLELLDAAVRGLDCGHAADLRVLPDRLAATDPVEFARQRDRELEILETFCDLWAFAGVEGVTGGVLAHLRRWIEGETDVEGPDLGAVRELYEGVDDLGVLLCVARGLLRVDVIAPAVEAVLKRWLRRPPVADGTGGGTDDGSVDDARRTSRVLDRLIAATEPLLPRLCDLARTVRFWTFLYPHGDARAIEVAPALAAADGFAAVARVVRREPGWTSWLPGAARVAGTDPAMVLAAVVAGEYTGAAIEVLPIAEPPAVLVAAVEMAVSAIQAGRVRPVVAVACRGDDVRGLLDREVRACLVANDDPVLEVVRTFGRGDAAVLVANLALAAWDLAVLTDTVVVTTVPADGRVQHDVFVAGSDGGWSAGELFGLHPADAARLELWRLREFILRRVPQRGPGLILEGTARNEPRDRRMFALVEVSRLDPTRDECGAVTALPELELAILGCLDAFRYHVSAANPGRLGWHRINVCVQPEWDLPLDVLHTVAGRIAHATRGLSLDQIVLRTREVTGSGTDRTVEDRVVHMVVPPTTGIQIGVKPPSDKPVAALTGYRRAAAELRRRGLYHPWHIVRLLTSPGAARSDLPPGEFTEFDLVAGRLQEVDCAPGGNTASVVVGLVSNRTATHPEGMRRVAVLSDPSRGMGSLSEAECVRILAALELAETEGLPIEWFAVSSGARIAMDSGTENLDWTAAVLRGLVEATQRGLIVNVVVAGINVGAQSYWNAEATILSHTRGTLIMVGDAAMVLTGKDALDYSGAVSASSNTGIGGFRGIMGPNGEAQHWAADMEDACRLLFRHYDHTYVAPGERAPRRMPTRDLGTRAIGDFPHDGSAGGFGTVGEVFDRVLNPDRKKPFDVRSVLASVADVDCEPLERWAHMAGAENAVVSDIGLAGRPVRLIGIESRDLPRAGAIPTDGPSRWTAGTLFPLSSKKVARAINAASGSRPVVVLANLSGFDGSPESMRCLQLEYGAELGRAVVNFRGPIVFCVLSRYHGGAFVVFSKRLNDDLESIAVEGAKASVLGGAPAAAVVFTREVDRRVNEDPRVQKAREALNSPVEGEATHSRESVSDVIAEVRAEVQGAVAREFDEIHTVERAREVGSIDDIVPFAGLRARLVAAVDRGLDRMEAR